MNTKTTHTQNEGDVYLSDISRNLIKKLLHKQNIIRHFLLKFYLNNLHKKNQEQDLQAKNTVASSIFATKFLPRWSRGTVEPKYHLVLDMSRFWANF
jgi:hypothetical protein